jgi:hypothetical protein
MTNESGACAPPNQIIRHSSCNAEGEPSFVRPKKSVKQADKPEKEATPQVVDLQGISTKFRFFIHAA